VDEDEKVVGGTTVIVKQYHQDKPVSLLPHRTRNKKNSDAYIVLPLLNIQTSETFTPGYKTDRNGPIYIAINR
jgi:hypothetical protein